MKFVIQRVTEAKVDVDGKTVGSIGKGYMVLVGVAQTDTKESADRMIRKMIALRIFDDENGKTNLSLADVKGELLLVSQFTLYADCKKGNRPSFVKAGSPQMASPMYDFVLQEAEKYVAGVQRGVFGADMKIELVNDGPFTIILDSDEIL